MCTPGTITKEVVRYVTVRNDLSNCEVDFFIYISCFQQLQIPLHWESYKKCIVFLHQSSAPLILMLMK